MVNKNEILFGGIFEGNRAMVINGVHLHVPEEQIKKLFEGANQDPNAPLSQTPNGDLCITLTPTGSFKVNISNDDLASARADYDSRNQALLK